MVPSNRARACSAAARGKWWEWPDIRHENRNPFRMLGWLKHGVKVRTLPAAGHLADEAPRDFEDAGRLETLQRVRNRLAA